MAKKNKFLKRAKTADPEPPKPVVHTPVSNGPVIVVKSDAEKEEFEAGIAAFNDYKKQKQEEADKILTEANDDARMIKASAETDAQNIRATAEGQAVIIKENAEVQAKKIIDTAEKTKGDADEYSKTTRADADNYSAATRSDADNYSVTTRKDADDYASNRKDEAETEAVSIRENAAKEAEEKVLNDMKDRIDSSKKEAEKIRKDAETETKELKNELKEKIKIQDKEIESLAKLKAEAQDKKDSAKKEAYEEVIGQIDSLEMRNKDLEEELGTLTGKYNDLCVDVKKKEGVIRGYEEIIGDITEVSTNISVYEKKIEQKEEDNKQLKEHCDELYKEISELKKQILKIGFNPEEVLEERDRLKEKIILLEEKVLNAPSPDELEELRRKKNQYDVLETTCEKIKEERDALEIENQNLQINKEELEAQKRFVKVLELQKYELRMELDEYIGLYNSNVTKVFPELSKIDKKEIEVIPSKMPDLKTLCNDFRKYLENRSENPLYYDDITIRTFIAGFASCRLMILEGLSGTGKSSLPKAFMKFIGAETIVVPVQSSWKDRNDLLGFYNDFKKQYKETAFLKALYTATHDHERIYCIVLDEMNLSRIEYYFADFLSVMENDDTEDWKVELVSDSDSIRYRKKSRGAGDSDDDEDPWPKYINDGKLNICDNTWFIGTANKDDSTFTITDKVYDRSVVVRFEDRGKPAGLPGGRTYSVNKNDFIRALEKAKKWQSTDDRKRYEKLITGLSDTFKKMFQLNFGNRIENQLESFVPVYVSCGGTIEEAVDIMFARKILRKVEGMFDEATKKNLGKFREGLGKNMPITKKQIELMESKI